MDSRSDGAAAARVATGVPAVGDTWTDAKGTNEDTAVRAMRVDPIPREDGKTFDVVVDYDTRPIGVYSTFRDWSAPQDFADPTARPPEIHYGFRREVIPIARALDYMTPPPPFPHDIAVVNSAGEPFDPPITREISRPILRIVRNEWDPGVSGGIGYDNAIAMAYVDTINSDDFIGALPKQVKMAGITADRHFESGMLYWRVTYELHFRQETWDVQVLDQGMRHWKTVEDPETQQSVDRLIENRDMYDNLYSEPRLLGTDGGLADVDVDDPRKHQENWLTFQVYEEKPFSGSPLNLSQLFT